VRRFHAIAGIAMLIGESAERRCKAREGNFGMEAEDAVRHPQATRAARETCTVAHAEAHEAESVSIRLPTIGSLQRQLEFHFAVLRDRLVVGDEKNALRCDLRISQ
jgi:hypothetical protein